MPEDRRLTIGSTSRLSPDEVARHTFATVRRGFDPAEVRAYLEMVGREIQAVVSREHELADALSEAERRAANPVLDESTLTAALGQETAKVLRSAHDAAAELVAKAEAECARLRSQAQEQSEQLQSHAEQHATERAAQAEAGAAEMRRRAQEEAAARLESAKLEAEALLSQARAECRAMVQEAQELRARVLSDLTRRRRVLHTQIEQLRAGRERLAATISEVRHTVDRVTDELFRAEDEARLAAEMAGRQAARSEEPEDVLAADAVPAVAEPAAAGEEEPSAGAPAGGGGDETRRVEELFARLRAEQAPDPVESVTLLGSVGAAGRTTEGAESAGAPQPGSVLTADRHEAEGSPSEEAATVGQEEGPAADPALARRDELLKPVAAALARRLKRALQDDQNDVLDRLRAHGGWSPDVLPNEEEHEERYVRAAVQQLDEASRAGATYAGAEVDEAPAVGAVAGELARAIVAPLRRRLLHGEMQADQGDDAALVEHVGAAFREWKGQRVERLATDEAVAAFSQAIVAVTAPDGHLRWIVDDDGAECPDCDDNALAGSVPRGDAFPTGHRHPPAHPGCRCLLAPDPA